MQVDPNNVPDKYMCEHCEHRPTDKKRARLIQLKKREDISGNLNKILLISLSTNLL